MLYLVLPNLPVPQTPPLISPCRGPAAYPCCPDHNSPLTNLFHIFSLPHHLKPEQASYQKKQVLQVETCWWFPPYTGLLDWRIRLLQAFSASSLAPLSNHHSAAKEVLVTSCEHHAVCLAFGGSLPASCPTQCILRMAWVALFRNPSL